MYVCYIILSIGPDLSSEQTSNISKTNQSISQRNKGSRTELNSTHTLNNCQTNQKLKIVVDSTLNLSDKILQNLLVNHNDILQLINILND